MPFISFPSSVGNLNQIQPMAKIIGRKEERNIEWPNCLYGKGANIFMSVFFDWKLIQNFNKERKERKEGRRKETLNVQTILKGKKYGLELIHSFIHFSYIPPQNSQPIPWRPGHQNNGIGE
jgi:hypothetical protein